MVTKRLFFNTYGALSNNWEIVRRPLGPDSYYRRLALKR